MNSIPSNKITSKEEMIKALEMRNGKDIQDKFSSATVAICGLGGLGSNVAIALARGGIGKLILIDFDYVDITNLHRQQYKANQVGMKKTLALKENLLEISPYLEIETRFEKIDEKNIETLVAEADIICEAFDNAEAKAMLVNYVLEKMPEKYLVAASGMAGFGSSNLIKTRKITDKFYLCGDEKSDVNSGIGLVSSRVMLCASHEANMILRLLAGKTDC